MNALTLITSRASPLKLSDPAPSAAEIESILHAADRAPDHGRLRPWRFVVIEGDARLRWGDVLAEALRRRSPQASPQQLESERQRPLRAPLIIVVVSSPREHPSIPQIEQLVAAGAAAQNLVLAAHALGYGAFWRTGSPTYDGHVRGVLGLKDADQVIGFIYIGTVVTPGKPRPLNTSEVVVRWGGDAAE